MSVNLEEQNKKAFIIIIITTDEIPGELSHENMISSQITCYSLHT